LVQIRALAGWGLASAFLSAFFALCFLCLVLWLGAACSVCADGVEEGAGTASAAQAGTTIKAKTNSNIFFMV
jgi:hypothetical protein